jgi:hypothetical protein
MQQERNSDTGSPWKKLLKNQNRGGLSSNKSIGVQKMIIRVNEKNYKQCHKHWDNHWCTVTHPKVKQQITNLLLTNGDNALLNIRSSCSTQISKSSAHRPSLKLLNLLLLKRLFGMVSEFINCQDILVCTVECNQSLLLSRILLTMMASLPCTS